MKELTENCIFKCECSSTTFIASDNLSKAISSDFKILTNHSILKLQTPGPCPKQNNVPCSCAVVNGLWCNTSSKMFIKGKSALIDKSYKLCPLGSKIKKMSSPVTSKINEKKKSPSFLYGAGNIANIGNKTTILDSFSGTSEHNADNLNEENQLEKEIKSEIENDDKKKTDDKFYCEYALCDYENCCERDKCDYIKASHSASSINNSASELEENFKNQYSEKYDTYIEKNMENNEKSTEGNWGKAAHHIISGNQIFAKHPYLVKLANFYKYDINNANNCILLPTIYSFGGKEGIVKQANGYVAMDLMRQQWHVGGHKYTLEPETIDEISKYLEKISSSNIEFYRDYVEAVDHEINILESRYKKNFCRKSNYDEKRKRFISNMNHISNKIMNKLLDFEKGYKKSYPFYVSKEAFKFAFDVPKRKKIIIIYKFEKYKKSSFYAVKLNVTRLQKDSYKVLFSNSDEFEIKDAISFIRFSENIRYFINLTDDYLIPWKIDKNREYVINDIMSEKSVSDYCSKNEQKIISFVEGRENGEMYYESPVRIIRERIDNILEN
ncbi:MAG: AHH domain-containing protein [Oscillospiraceae bacterium]|nr:AHH domain-containing protein [Oscillospiraceae bacterium]MDY3258504.1 AHH domain-containing protein [Ruminococcus callidus]